MVIEVKSVFIASDNCRCGRTWVKNLVAAQQKKKRQNAKFGFGDPGQSAKVDSKKSPDCVVKAWLVPNRSQNPHLSPIDGGRDHRSDPYLAIGTFCTLLRPRPMKHL